MNDESGAQLTPCIYQNAPRRLLHLRTAASQILTDPDQPPVHTKFCVGALRTAATGRASAAWDGPGRRPQLRAVPAAASLSAAAAAASSRWRRCSARRRAAVDVPGARARRAHELARRGRVDLTRRTDAARGCSSSTLGCASSAATAPGPRPRPRRARRTQPLARRRRSRRRAGRGAPASAASFLLHCRRGHDDAPRASGVDAAQQRGVPRLVLARRLVEVRVRRACRRRPRSCRCAWPRPRRSRRRRPLAPWRWVKVRVARPAPAQRTAGSFPMPAALQGGALRLAGCILVGGVEASALSRRVLPAHSRLRPAVNGTGQLYRPTCGPFSGTARRRSA